MYVFVIIFMVYFPVVTSHRGSDVHPYLAICIVTGAGPGGCDVSISSSSSNCSDSLKYCDYN